MPAPLHELRRPLPERWSEAEARRHKRRGRGAQCPQPDVLSHLSRTPATTPVRVTVEKGL